MSHSSSPSLVGMSRPQLLRLGVLVAVQIDDPLHVMARVFGVPLEEVFQYPEEG
jgi:hypothetical protein